ncbi:MAG: ATPase domain-containing protein [Candidatus Aenigmatarchaeota archaeon]
MRRVKTGIPGLDDLLNGGIPERNVVLLSGGPGTGKTIFAQQFLWNGLQMEENGVYVALEEHPAVNNVNAKRVVIDSVTSLYIDKPSVARKIVLTLKRVFAGLGTTSIFVSQISVGERGFGGPGVEHGVDGIIRLDLDEINGELKRSLIIWKMRGTSHSMKRHEFEITDKGIIVHKDRIVKL